MMGAKNEMLRIFVENNTLYSEQLTRSRKTRLFFSLNSRLRKLHARCETAQTPDDKNAALAELLNAFESLPAYKAAFILASAWEDIRVLHQQWGKRRRLDHSDAHAKDYYSIALIVKNEARYMREFVLFYQATGVDRIYLYDNDSTDNLLEVLKPFIDAGYVVYQKWPGSTVQTAAYRDAVRRTKHRTTWLALIDADEFLFSPKGSMPEQLKAYEQYPGIGVNWIAYGPNGHVSRPDGLVMDNYTTTFADYDEGINHHIKSIVQPTEVLCIHHTHFAIYKKNRCAVGEDGHVIDNYAAFAPRAGRAFTRHNQRSVFRINHYWTKSLEDLEEKSKRGYPDGSPSRRYDNEPRVFEERPLLQDYSIKAYADMVRARYGSYEES